MVKNYVTLYIDNVMRGQRCHFLTKPSIRDASRETESFSLQKENRVHKPSPCRGTRLALFAIVRPYPSVGSFCPFSGLFAVLRGSFCCPAWALFQRFSWLVYRLCESSPFSSLFFCLCLCWCSRWFVSGSMWDRSCTR